MIQRIIKYFIYIFSFLSIRNNKVIIIGSWFGDKFADNSKYIYLSLLRNSRYKVYWVTKSDLVYDELNKNNYPVIKYLSFQSIFIHLRAKYYFTSTGKVDVCYWLLGRAKHIELWHGIPLKKIIFDDDIFERRYHKKLSRMKNLLHDLFYTIIYPSENYRNIYISAFNVKNKNLLCAGQPRNDVFFDKRLEDSSLPSILYNKKYIIYLPTHRKEGKEKIDINNTLNLEKLDQLCKVNNIYFIIKKHFYHKNEITDLENYPNIIDLTNINNIDTQMLMKYSSALITDYSSCFIDYLLLDKPILIYTYDYEKYQLEDRGLYFPYSDVIPSEMILTFDSLCVELNKVIMSGSFPITEKQRKVKSFFYEKNNQKESSLFILNEVLNLNEE